MREDARVLLGRAADEVDRLSKREFRSREDAFASLFEVQAQLNAALARACEDDGSRLYASGLHEQLESLIGKFIEVVRQLASRFEAPSYSITASGWPPSVSVTLSWGLVVPPGRT